MSTVAAQPDERRHRAQVERDRQQHGDRRHRPDAGQHADERAEQHPDQRKQEVDRRDRDGEAQYQVMQDLHAA